MHRIYIHVKHFQKKRTTLEALFHDDDGEDEKGKSCCAQKLMMEFRIFCFVSFSS